MISGRRTTPDDLYVASGSLEYVDDDEIVPKNASVVVRRVPAKSAKAGLMARINNRGAVPGNAL